MLKLPTTGPGGRPTDRRTFLGTLAAGAASLSAGSLALAAEDAKTVIPIVDTHQHLWDLKKLKLPWLQNEGVKSINRDFLMSDYLEATRGLGVSKTVYMEVNVAQDYQDREAEWVIDLCRQPGTVYHALDQLANAA